MSLSETRIRRGELRTRVGELLRSDRFLERLGEWLHFPARQVVSPLFAYLCASEELLKWRAVTAMGLLVAKMADEDMESARVIMRRLIWSLNDESGGIGWGAPEAMGEIMASHGGLAGEYYRILASYIREDGNDLENVLLERGVLWGLGRLAQVRPHLLVDSIPALLGRLHSEDPVHRGLALWTLGLLRAAPPPGDLGPFLNDLTEISVFENGGLKRVRIFELAQQALDRTGLS